MKKKVSLSAVVVLSMYLASAPAWATDMVGETGIVDSYNSAHTGHDGDDPVYVNVTGYIDSASLVNLAQIAGGKSSAQKLIYGKHGTKQEHTVVRTEAITPAPINEYNAGYKAVAHIVFTYKNKDYSSINDALAAIEREEPHYFSVNANDSGNPTNTNWNNDGATGANAIAIGRYAQAVAEDALAVGTSNRATQRGAIALGLYNMASGVAASAIGRNNIADNDSAISWGLENVSSGTHSIAIGNVNHATAFYSVALGDQNIVSGSAAFATGRQNVVSGASGVGVGAGNTVGGTQAAAFGTRNSALGVKSAAIGFLSVAKGLGTFAAGYINNADADEASAVGYYNHATGVRASAFGSGNTASGTKASAFGMWSVASGERSAAFGYSASAQGTDSLALNGTAKLEGSVSLGTDSVADRPAGGLGYLGVPSSQSGTSNTAWKSTRAAVSIGDIANDVSRQITGLAAGTEDADAVNVAQLKRLNNLTIHYASEADHSKATLDGKGGTTLANVKAGTLSADSKEAVNGSQLYATNIKVGENSAAIKNNASAIAANKTSITTNASNISKNVSDIASNKTAIDKNKTDIASNKTAIDKNKTDIASNKTAIDKNKTDIASNKTAIDKNKTDIASNKTAIDKNKTDIASNKTAIDKNKNDIASNKTAIDKNKTDIASNKTAIDKNKTDIASNKTAIDKNKTDIASNKTAIDKNKTDIASNTTVINQNRTSIENNRNSITNIQHKLEVQTEKPLTFKANEGKSLNRKLGETLEVYGTATTKGTYSSGNIKTVTTARGLEVQFADSPVFKGTVQAERFVSSDGKKSLGNDGLTIAGDKPSDKVTVDKNGLKISDGPSVTRDGVDAGGKPITNVGKGTKDSDVATVSQVKDEVNKVSTTVSNSSAELNHRIEAVSSRVTTLDNRVDKVGAMAAAFSGIQPLAYDEQHPTSVSLAYGAYSGKGAVALGISHYINRDVLLNGGMAVAGDEKSFRFGASFRLGRSVGNATVAQTQKLSAAMAAKDAQIQELSATVKELVQKVHALEEAR